MDNINILCEKRDFLKLYLLYTIACLNVKMSCAQINDFKKYESHVAFQILVLAGGRVKEFDSPQNLLNNVSSAYYEMARESFIV